MIILHNHMSKESREFIQEYGSGNTVISWYEGGREEWKNAGGIFGVSAFPSIIVDIPEYKVPAHMNLDDEDIPEQLTAAKTITIRKPTSLDDIQNELDKINVRLVSSAAADMPIANLTMETMSLVSDELL